MSSTTKSARQETIEMAGMRAIILHRKSRRLEDVSDPLITVPDLSATLVGLCLKQGTRKT